MNFHLFSSFSTLLLFIVLVSCASALQIGARSAGPTVDLGYAKYTGVVDEATNITNFLGVRYAAAPIGALRWRAPRKPAPTPGIQLANTQPSSCHNGPAGTSPASPFRNGTFITGGTSVGSPTESEDCLFLNIHTPGTKQQDLLPVIIYIHGGGYVGGDAAFYNGEHLIQEAGGRLVFVTIQYRLGAFGFLAGKAMKEHGDLNVGLLDQQFALTWVQKHIEKFGGDPEKVTIWGTSAGGGSVIQQVIANDGNTTPPLFRAAMTSSAFLPSQYNYDDHIPETIFKEFVSQTGCASSLNVIKCLRDTDVKVLQNANENLGSSNFFGTFTFVPVVDGTLITRRPTEAFRRRILNGDLVLSFTASHEGNIFANPSVTDLRYFVAQLFPTFGQKEINKTIAQYAKIGSPTDQAITIMSEAIFVCPTYFLQTAFFGRSFKGEFAVPPGLHGSDLLYLFPLQGQPPFNNKPFIDALGQSLTNFVLALNPNRKIDPTNITPHWNRWNGKKEMLFNRTEEGAPVIKEIKTSAGLLERCAFWEKISSVSGQ